MGRPFLRRVLPLGAMLLTLVGCGNSTTSPTTTTATCNPPSSGSIACSIDTFAGTVTMNGAVTHTFSSTKAGVATATVTAVSPDSSTVLGVSMGIWNGQNCGIVISNDNAVAGNVLTGTVARAGDLCVRVYDVGKFSNATSYEIVVLHP